MNLVVVLQEGDDRDVENKLVLKLEFDKFEVIKELLRNRLKVVWCMRLERAQDEAERQRIEVCSHFQEPSLTHCQTA